jgi:hypothetical protein
MTCVKCGSRAMVEGVRVIDRTENYVPVDLTVRVDRNPGALLFKGAVSSTLKARVCGDCGFIELFAGQPAALLRASKARKPR